MSQNPPQNDQKTIHLMDDEIIRQLSSGQVIIDSESVIKELFENALDSGATAITIKLNNYGLDEIIVEDNGSGISEDNLELIGKRHCTSKLTTIEDINSIGTYGFRGEALYSISAMADVEIITCDGNRNANSIQLSTRLKKKVTRKQGTTVIVKRLFNNNKIRREEFIRNKVKELNKITALLQNYALMLENIKIVFTHQLKKSISIVLQSNGKSLTENLYNVFKTDVKDVNIPIDFENEIMKIKGIVSNFSDKGRVSSDRMFFFVNKRPIEHKKIQQIITQQWRSLGSSFKKKFPTVILNIIVDEYDPNVTPDKKKVFFVDEEKVLNSIEKCIEQVWSLDALELDLKNSKSSPLVSSNSKDSIDSSTSISPISKLLNLNSLPLSTQKLIQQKSTQKEKDYVELTYDDFMNELHTPMKMEEEQMKEKQSPEKQQRKSGQMKITDMFTMHKKKSNESLSIHQYDQTNGLSSEDNVDENYTQLERKPIMMKQHQQFVYQNSEIEENEEEEESEEEYKNHKEKLQKESKKIDNLLNQNSSLEDSLMKIRLFSSKSQDSEDARTSHRKEQKDEKDERKHKVDDIDSDVVLKSKDHVKDHIEQKDSIEMIEQKTKKLLEMKTQQRIEKVNKTIITPKDSIHNEDEIEQIHNSDIDLVTTSNRLIVEPTEMKTLIELMILNHQDYPLCKPRETDQEIIELPKKMKKQTIKQIEIIGQFNKGFIIGKINFDLYIIDQHAADEIYNYETLLKKDKLNVQPLINPLSISLTSDDELFVQENIDLFPQFGFEIQFRESNEPTQRVYLTKVYHRGKTIFGANEFIELVQQLKQCNNDQTVIIKKKHKIFATEACRMSIMIGDPLNKNEMKTILSHLTELNKPWHCPHGRQTIRHLFDLRKSFNSIANIMN